MLKIRLQRVGRKNDASFRIVVTDSKRGVKSGDNVEILGSYTPRTNKAQVKSDRVKYWISVGAGVSDTVHNLLINEKIIEGKKINVLPKKSPIAKPEEEKKEEVPKEEAKTEEKAEEEEEATPVEEAPKEEKVEEKKEEVKEDVKIEEENQTKEEKKEEVKSEEK